MTIIISHRSSTVRRADRIVVLEGGRVTEDGTHDELIEASGRYAHLFSLQASRFSQGSPTACGNGGPETAP
jgi:ATP-binding cassette subfamily B protein